MGLAAFIFGIAIILIVALLLASVLSPDRWGQISQGCNENCSGGISGTSCSGGGGVSGESSSGTGDPAGKSGEKSLQTTKGSTKVVCIDEKGQTKNEDIIKEGHDLAFDQLKQSMDPYSANFEIPLWKQYVLEKEKAYKENYVAQSTFVVTPRTVMKRFRNVQHTLHPK